MYLTAYTTIIVFFNKEGKFDHITHGRDNADTRKLFELLKETRSAKKLPRMELHLINFGGGSFQEQHIKEL